jgi:hypothetical protein
MNAPLVSIKLIVAIALLGNSAGAAVIDRAATDIGYMIQQDTLSTAPQRDTVPAAARRDTIRRDTVRRDTILDIPDTARRTLVQAPLVWLIDDYPLTRARLAELNGGPAFPVLRSTSALLWASPGVRDGVIFFGSSGARRTQQRDSVFGE